MSEPRRKLINPFELAKLASGIHTKVDVRDVRLLQPGITEGEARMFLAANKHAIAYAMLFAGTQTIRALLERPEAN